MLVVLAWRLRGMSVEALKSSSEVSSIMNMEVEVLEAEALEAEVEVSEVEVSEAEAEVEVWDAGAEG
jgi:hypothetical protein